MAAVRMVCSFISIKVTATYLGPPGLALVAQYSNFVTMFQSMLGQGLVTGMVRLAAEHGAEVSQRRVLFSTALRMGAVMVLLLSIILAAVSPYVAEWLLTDRKYTLLIAFSGVAVAAGVLNDILLGALGVSKELGLIARATIAATVLGLIFFAPLSVVWGINGGLWGTFVAMLLTAVAALAVAKHFSRHVRVSDFLGEFNINECKKILAFYPMLIVNGVLPPLALILVRDSLVAGVGLNDAGIWQATWRLSEVYQAIIISSVTLYFMPSMGERNGRPLELRKQILRTLTTAVVSTAVAALAIFILRDFVVHFVFSSKFADVQLLLPLQLVGDVLKIAGWILGMSLVATVRSSWFIASVFSSSLVFVILTRMLIPGMGIESALWAYIVADLIQISIAVYALRDILFSPAVSSKI